MQSCDMAMQAINWTEQIWLSIGQKQPKSEIMFRVDEQDDSQTHNSDILFLETGMEGYKYVMILFNLQKCRRWCWRQIVNKM